jgi:hypothetical protein
MKMEFREYECGCVGLYLESNPLKGDERPPIYRFQDCRRGGYEDDNDIAIGGMGCNDLESKGSTPLPGPDVAALIENMAGLIAEGYASRRLRDVFGLFMKGSTRL